MATISLCMIVKNEQATLQRALQSVKDLVDEIIIVDTGSTDSTKQIALNFTKKVFDFVWCDNFSKARNFCFSKASCEYIMWLDADDVVPPNTLRFLQKIKPTMNSDCYMLKYDVSFCMGKPTYSFYRERILKNDERCFWQGAVHECIVPYGKIEKLDVSIEHKKEKTSDSNRNIKIYNKLKKQRPLNQREQYYYSRELFDHKKYKMCISNLKKLFQMQNVWVENIIEAYYLMSQCYFCLGERDKEYECLLKTFYYDVPRANICCKIADYFLHNKKYTQSVYWYSLATNCKNAINSGAFVEQRYYDYYPYMGLCCAYFYLNDYKLSNEYNNKAGQVFMTKEVEFNKQLLEKYL